MKAKKTANKMKAKTPKRTRKKELLFTAFLERIFKANHFTTMGLIAAVVAVFLMGIATGIGIGYFLLARSNPISLPVEKVYWMELHRKSEKEFLYFGAPGDKEASTLVKSFTVKTGRPGERPTPLPQALGKKYWKIVKKYSSMENPETAPYFLELDVPIEDGYFGPVPYNECNGPASADGSIDAQQCAWELPGYFGLHGVNGDVSRLSNDDPGSSGCIRHTDQDITYLYNILEVDEGVRYYVSDI